MSINSLTSYQPLTINGLDTLNIGGDPFDPNNYVSKSTYTDQTINSKLTVPSFNINGATASKIPIFDASKNLVSSGVDAVKITFLDNVSSDIQSQLNNKLDKTTGGLQTVSSSVEVNGTLYAKDSLYTPRVELTTDTSLLSWRMTSSSGGAYDLTFNNAQTSNNVIFRDTGKIEASGFMNTGATSLRVAVFDVNKNIASSSINTTELSYLSGASSNLQTQINGKGGLTTPNYWTNQNVFSWETKYYEWLEAYSRVSLGGDAFYIAQNLETYNASSFTAISPATISNSGIEYSLNPNGTSPSSMRLTSYLFTDISKTYVALFRIKCPDPQCYLTVKQNGVNIQLGANSIVYGGSGNIYITPAYAYVLVAFRPNTINTSPTNNPIYFTFTEYSSITWDQFTLVSLDTTVRANTLSVIGNVNSNLNLGNNFVYMNNAPTLNTQATNKQYVDSAISTSTSNLLASNNTWTGTNTYSNLSYFNDIVRVSRSGISNRKIVLYDGGANNDHNFYGFGINSGILRYQINTTADNHVWYAGASTTVSNELMRLTGTGKLGIGTTDPQSLLHLLGGASNTEIRICTNDNYKSRLGMYEDSVGSTWGAFVQYNGVGDDLEFGHKRSGTDTVDMAIDLNGNASIRGTATIGGIVYPSQYGRNGDLRTGVKPSNVSATSFRVDFGTFANNGTGNFADCITLNTCADSSGGAVNMIAFNKGGYGIRQYQGTYGSTTAMTAYSDCVMTDANSANVSLGGSIAIGLYGNYIPGCIYSDDNWGMLLRAKKSSPNLAEFAWYNGGGTERMRLNGNNLWVGTQSGWGNSIYLKASTSSSYHVAEDSTGRTAFFGVDDSGYGMVGSYSNHDFVIRTNNTQRMRITTAGYVGIGSSSTTTVLPKMLIVDGNTGSWNTGSWQTGQGLMLSNVANPSASSSALTFAMTNGNQGWISCLAPGISWLDLVIAGSTVYFASVGSIVAYTVYYGIYNVSDEREKEDIQPLKTESSLKRVLNARPVHYRRKCYDEKTPVPEEMKQKRCIGFLAQEIQESNPHCVSEWENKEVEKTEDDDGMRLGICYNDYVVHLVGAVQELHKRNEQQQKTIDLLVEHGKERNDVNTRQDEEIASLRLQLDTVKKEFDEYKRLTEERFDKLASLLLGK